MANYYLEDGHTTSESKLQDEQIKNDRAVVIPLPPRDRGTDEGRDRNNPSERRLGLEIHRLGTLGDKEATKLIGLFHMDNKVDWSSSRLRWSDNVSLNELYKERYDNVGSWKKN
ncbi:hypothetical protein AHAS_Ahas16G0151800 [Arachis hypogaea]